MAIRRFSSSNLSGGKSSKVWDQTTTPGYYESIATATVDNSTPTTIEFTNIPQNYAHLQIRAIILGSGYSKLQFNGDTTGSNYRDHYVGGNGGATIFAGTNANYAGFADSGSANGMAVVMDILDYTSTVKYKTQRSIQGWDNNGSGEVYLTSSVWLNSSIAAITSLKITAMSGSFSQYSQFALYGIKGA